MKNSGFSLLEVLIALVVLSMGLLGLAALQITGLKNNQSAYYRTTATVLAYDMADRMRLNRSVAEGGGYNLAIADAAPTGTVLADIDRISWLNSIATALPVGDGAIGLTSAGGKQIVTITVQWDDSRGTSGSATQSFVMSTEL
jgi:type IV pilus assembly protein PilV